MATHSDADVIKDVLKSKIVSVIAKDLTIGRKNDYLKPFTQDKIDKFIEENNDKIDLVVKRMMDAYLDIFNDLNLLKNPPSLGWIREYLYEVVNTQIEQGENLMEQVD